jgi:hypothetical protein
MPPRSYLVIHYNTKSTQGGDQTFGLEVSENLDAPLVELVPAPDGMVWGKIPDCIAVYPSTTPIVAGNIVVPLGNVAEGLRHTRKHAAKISHLNGGMSVEDYICNVLRHFQTIYLQEDGSLLLIRTNGIRKCAVVVPILLDGIPAYKLITAYPLPREPPYAKRKAVRLIFD